MAEYKKLTDAIQLYLRDDETHFLIPEHYFWDMLKTWQSMEANGQLWTPPKAAATLLQLAFNDGYLQPNLLTSEGHQALAWADSFMDQVQLHILKEMTKAS